MSTRREPTLNQIAPQWLCLWQMSWQLLAFTPAALARELANLSAAPKDPR